LAPQVGLEPTTLRLTAECSAIELLRSVVLFNASSKVAERKRYVKIFPRCGDSNPRAGPFSNAYRSKTEITKPRDVCPKSALAVR